MNFCSKCGAENNEGVKFCSKCGNSLTNEIKEEGKKKEKMATASMVIGIIALVLSVTCVVFVPIFLSIPLAIVGLVLGIVNLCKKGKRFSGIILNSASILISIIMAFVVFPILIAAVGIGAFTEEAGKDGSDINKALNKFYNELERETSDNYIAGKYNCKSFSGSGESSNYIVRLELNRNNTFLWGKYGDTKNNYVTGTYTFSDLEKTNASGEYKYYSLNLTGEEFYENGVKQDTPYASEYEFGITAKNTKKHGVIMNVKTYNMYYCYEEK